MNSLDVEVNLKSSATVKITEITRNLKRKILSDVTHYDRTHTIQLNEDTGEYGLYEWDDYRDAYVMLKVIPKSVGRAFYGVLEIEKYIQQRDDIDINCSLST